MGSFCRGCGTSMEEGERFCANCGADASSEGATTPALDPAVAFGIAPDPSGKAIFSLVCGVLSFFPPFALVAIIFGHLSLSEIRRSAGRLKGRGLAIAGLILGYLAVAATITLVVIAVVSIPRPGKELASYVSTNQPSAVSAVRTLNTAEIAYAQAHPASGYTCSLSELSNTWSINHDLADIKKNGYLITLQGCSTEKSGGPVTRYQVVTYPAPTERARLPAFCSNQTDVIKVDWTGSPEKCLNSGVDLLETDVNHPKGWTQSASH